MRFSKLCLAAGSLFFFLACDPAEMVLRNRAATPAADPCPASGPAPASFAPAGLPMTRARLMTSAARDLDRQNIELQKVVRALRAE